MKTVIVLDDFGLCKSVNNGIIYVLERSTIPFEVSLMVYGKAVKHAIKNMPKSTRLGIHLDPLGWQKTKKVSTTQDYIDLFKNHSSDYIEKLVLEELKRFTDLTGNYPTHITSHKGIHSNFKVLQAILIYAKQHNIPMRRANTALNLELTENSYASNIMIRRSGLVLTDALIACIEGNTTQKVKNCIIENIKRLKEQNTGNKQPTAEILFHPGFIDKELIELSSLNYLRGRDLSILLDKDFIKKLENMGVKFVNYSDL